MIERPMHQEHRTSWKRIFFGPLTLGASGLMVVALYLYPHLRYWPVNGAVDIPCAVAADLYLYLKLSDLEAVGDSAVLNPWYGVTVPAADLAYLRFGLSFRLFSLLRSICDGSWVLSLLVWQGLLTAAIFGSAALLLRVSLPEQEMPWLALGVVFLVLVDPTTLVQIVSAWSHLLSSGDFGSVRLPYMRSFFPQVGVALLLGYLVLQIRALNGSGRWKTWLAMAVLQWIGLLTFPYAVLLMATVTGLSLLALRFVFGDDLRWRGPLLYALACAVFDVSYLLLSGGSRAVPYDKIPFKFDPTQLAHWFGGSVVVLLGFPLLLLIQRHEEHRAALGTLASLGAATGFLLFADVFLVSSLQVSAHIAYFSPTSIAILLVYMFLVFQRRSSERRKAVGWVPFLGISLLFVHGMLAAQRTYLRGALFCGDLVDQSTLLESAGARRGDLVIAPARSVNQAGWIPLAIQAQVLYARDAEFVLPPSRLDLHRDRQALYLYLSGWDQKQLEEMLAGPLSATAPVRWREVMRIRDVLERDEERIKVSVRGEILGRLMDLESSPSLALPFFRQYDRVVILDRIHQPMFVEDRLIRFLDFREETQGDIYRLRQATPR